MAKEKDETSTELVPLPPQALGILEMLDIRFTDGAAIQWRIAEQLAYAGSVDDLLNGAGPAGLREHLGEEFQIRAVDYLPSRYPGNPVYAVIDAVNRDGEPVVYTTGALSVVIQLAKGLKMGWWTNEWVKARYSSDEPTADGNRPYMLTRA